MKKKRYQLASVVFIAFIALIVSSYSAGLGLIGNTNGSGDNQNMGSCAGTNCHAANTSQLIVNLKVERPNDTLHLVQNSYQPNAVYKIYITGFNTSSNHSEYSYQMSILNVLGGNAGFVVLPNHLRQVYISGTDVYEPKAPIFSGTNNYVDSITWVAPPANSGKVTINLTMLASNNDGTFNGDLANATKYTLQEQALNANELVREDDLKLFPNPATDHIMLATATLAPGIYDWVIYDSFGRIVKNKKWTIRQQVETKTISISELPTGTYFFTLQKPGEKISHQFVKL